MKRFNNLKIRTKLLISFFILAVFTGVIGIIGITNMKSMYDRSKTMYNENFIPIQDLKNIQITLQQVRALQVYLLYDPDTSKVQSRLDEISNLVEQTNESLTRYETNQLEDKEIVYLQSVKDSLAAYRTARDANLDLIKDGDRNEALANAQEVANAREKADKELQNLVDYNMQHANDSVTNNADTYNNLTIIMIAIIIGTVSAAVLLGLFISAIISKPVKKMVDAANKLAAGDLDSNIEVDSKDEIGEFAHSFGEALNTIKNLVPLIETLSTSCVEGRLDKRAEEGSFKGAYKNIIVGLNNMLDTLVGHIDAMPTPVMIIDKEFSIQYMNKFGAELLGTSQKQLIGTKCYDNFKTSDCKTMKCACANAMQQGIRANSETDAHPRGMNLDISYSALPIKDQNQKVIGAIELVVDQTVIKNAQRVAKKQNDYQNIEVSKLLANIENLSQGKLTYNASIESTDDDTKEIGETFKKIYSSYGASIDAINSYIKEIGEILTEMSNCNLNVETSGEYKGDFIEIKNSLDSIIKSFNETISNINTASEQVASGSDQISNSSMTLSQGATEQASSIEELTASLEEISSQTKLNAQNANQANELAENAKTNAIQGNGQMKEMLKAMEEINESSSNISKIIKVIDDIAFQTNILALNAAVEAARAGQHGKGFAVVAEEVRNLAARSANAAKETTEMIEGSIKKAEGGTRIAKDTADALGRIVTGVEKVANLVSDIAVASNEQASGISQINQGIMQVSQVVQSNSATSEEGAAASEELSSQASLMRDMVSRFKLKKSNRSFGKMEDLSPEVLAMLENMTDKKNKHSEPTEDTKNSKHKQLKPRITLSDKEFGKY